MTVPARLPTHLRLVAPLGLGGSGEVWVARDRRAGRDVAVKLVDAGETELLRRLSDEARALTRLAGARGVPRLFAVGSDGDGHAWLVSELVEGVRLDAVVRDGSLPGGRVVDLVSDLASTLAGAHARGVVHGDVAPANVVLVESRGPVLLDWGLAGLGDAGAGTVTALTPGYASPERRRGRPVSAAGDVYAVSALGLALVTGQDPDPAALVPTVPTSVDEPLAGWLRAGLSVDPRRRPGAGDLAAALGSGVVAGEEPRRRWRLWGRGRGRR